MTVTLRIRKSCSNSEARHRAMLDSSFLSGITTSSVVAFQSTVGVGLVRSQPRSFPSRARRVLGDKNQYEMAAMMRYFCPSLTYIGGSSASIKGRSNHRTWDVVFSVDSDQVPGVCPAQPPPAGEVGRRLCQEPAHPRRLRDSRFRRYSVG